MVNIHVSEKLRGGLSIIHNVRVPEKAVGGLDGRKHLAFDAPQ